MTIRLPPENFLDRILEKFGIKRKIILPEPDSFQQNKNPYITKKAKKESVVKAIYDKITKH
jgi:hypothetical protein